MSRSLSILKRGVMIQPTLSLLFGTQEEAEKAMSQHLCLCRNEDVLLPETLQSITLSAFEAIQGVELQFGEAADSFLVGYNRFQQASPMYGRLLIVHADEENLL